MHRSARPAGTYLHMRTRSRNRGGLTRLLATIAAGLLGLLAAGVLASCGGDSDSSDAARTDMGAFVVPLPPARGPATRVEADAEDVVRRWADTLRRGDVAGAAALFSLPTVVANGTRPVTLDTRTQVRMFNDSLPCGAIVLDVVPAAHGFLVATVRLTERPGPGSCGSGAGNTARTAFLVEDGRIAFWLRLPDRPADPAPAPEPEEAPPPAPEPPSSPEESIA